MYKFPHYTQLDEKDCGPTCIKIIAKYFGKTVSIDLLRRLSETTREGSSLLGMSDAAEQIGFKTLGAKMTLESLDEMPLPCVLHWNSNHFVVLYKVPQKRNFFLRFFKKESDEYRISDPGFGLLKFTKEQFLKCWIGNNIYAENDEGIVLLFETTPKFYNEDLDQDKKALGFRFLSKYILKYKAFIFQLLIGLLAGSLLQLIFPFLTQSVVDIGIQNQNIHFIYMILVAQLFLFLGETILEFIRGWILLHLSTRINISLISDFFIKLMSLPISFFDVKMTGDIMQRINDHHRIEKMLTTSSLNVLFSLFNIVILGGVLAYYNLKIFGVFFIGSLLYFVWIVFFLKRREMLDYKRFSETSQEQSKVIELINGMQEIKLHNAEKQKRWGWENVQARLFKISLKGLVLEQTQNIGSNFINELKNIIIIFLSAKLVIDGQITLGMMMGISSIVGNLNMPIIQLIDFVREAQDAKISLTRLAEIHDREEETQNEDSKTNDIPKNADIIIKNMSFRYTGAQHNVLENLNLTIPANKITAIVGTSGSGKTTLMKILLKFYEPNSGEIILNPTNNPEFHTEQKIKSNTSLDLKVDLKNISQKSWRYHVGTVMQEGYIFNDSIANNIAIGVDTIDKKKLLYATDVANIKDFIEEYPLGFNTKIGMEGVGMSTGQKQRLLIARAVYKDPEMLFFDEATSALDSNNEKTIMEKLNVFFKNKTVVVIAHRLSTVMNADQIVVLDHGKIIEKGNHEDLVMKRGAYYELVRNQLQLGN